MPMAPVWTEAWSWVAEVQRTGMAGVVWFLSVTHVSDANGYATSAHTAPGTDSVDGFHF